jgi:hypothetical protein
MRAVLVLHLSDLAWLAIALVLVTSYAWLAWRARGRS